MDLEMRGLLARRDLLAAGVTEDELRRWRRTGELTSVRRGVYASVGDIPNVPMARHALVVPSWAVPLDRVHVTRKRRYGGRVDRVLHLHSAWVEADEVVVVDDVAVTSVARTVVDCARALPFEQAVVIADAALGARLVTGLELADAVQRSARRRGNSSARRVIGFAGGRSESVGESRSRVALWRSGLPGPVFQWQVGDLGRVDFGWPPQRRSRGVRRAGEVRPAPPPGSAAW